MGCNYADTVDISHVPLTNGSYNYHGLQIPVHLTGIYDFEHLVGGNERRVKRHLRACVCKLRPCMRVCCPRNQISENGECSDKVKKELAEVQPTIEKRIFITNIAVQSDLFGFCDEFFDLSDDELIMFEVTLRYFFAVGSILWLFVVSHRTRKGLTSMSLNDPRYRFRAYSVYVWGSTTFLTAVVILTDRIWGNDLSTLKWTPSVGFAQCWLYRNSSGMLIFFIGPILVLCNINGVILILTIINMWKTERKVKKSIRVKLSSASQT
ncbi:probable G-protein coupled receptor Mth-like 6 [Drosophila gunungcola]|uniref:probable G-protein coupled receptor Mth-like 6 n=1 Tax=Drosophila gunungcola TaxID=103775 RepID=UPI0022E717F6|nr:probable G-protein coupled receptor Mth-like 6 [Drosophila gunungcola]